ncbi:MAG TPA: CocE/NonD family hydrolase [Actinomycetota bacterium]|nr:CocE/NonD family hydrolase [Actinomycetota bacterium]
MTNLLHSDLRRPLVALLCAFLFVGALAVEVSAQEAGGQIEMSDGVALSAEVLLPEEGKRFPVLLNMTPYGPATYFSQYLTEGYAHVNVDIRGTGGSGGALCIFCEREQQDVYEVVEWVARQKWSNGKVGMFGGSYQGITPILGAAKQPPHLKAIVPAVTYADAYRDIVWHNGIYNLDFVAQWLTLQTALSMTGTSASTDLPARAEQRLVTESRLQPWDSAFYKERSVNTKYDQIKVPVLHLGGWFDGFSRGTLDNFRGVASKHNRLVMQPCTHKGCGAPFDAGSEYAADASAPGLEDPVLAWMDHFLKGKDNGVEDGPPVLYYDIGASKWLSDKSWPPRSAELKTFFLSGAASGSMSGAFDGSLVDKGVDDQDVEDHYVYDPTVGIAETFSKWGTVAASPHYRADQRADSVRSLSYTTAEMKKPLSLAGPMELNFWGATTAEDTDWIVKVSDVAPSGESKLVSSGYVRASHRRWDPKRSRPGRPWLPNTSPATVPPGKVLEYRIDIWDIAHTVKEGHRLRISISSSDSPNHEPLPDPALNYLFHSGAYPSKLLVTVR